MNHDYRAISGMNTWRDNKSGTSVQGNYRKTIEVVRHVIRTKEEHIVRRMLDVETGLKEDNTMFWYHFLGHFSAEVN